MMRCTALVRLALCLSVAAGASVAQPTLDADLLKSPKDGGARRWVVNGDAALRAAPGADAAVIGALSDASVLSNLGCAAQADGVWCQVRAMDDGTRGYVDSDRLQPAIGPDGTLARGEDDSARRARARDFDATAQVPCAQERGQAMGTCRAAIARGGGGDASLVVTFPDGFARTLSFVHGAFTRASATMSGVGTDTDWRVEGRAYIIRVDDQRYEVPTALVLGGEGSER